MWPFISIFWVFGLCRRRIQKVEKAWDCRIWAYNVETSRFFERLCAALGSRRKVYCTKVRGWQWITFWIGMRQPKISQLADFWLGGSRWNETDRCFHRVRGQAEVKSFDDAIIYRLRLKSQYFIRKFCKKINDFEATNVKQCLKVAYWWTLTTTQKGR